MATDTLQPNGETHTDDDWPAMIGEVPGGTRLGNVLDDVDANCIAETVPDTDTITYEFEAFPSGSAIIGLDVWIRAKKLTVGDIQIAAVLYIDSGSGPVSKGVVLTPVLENGVWNNYTLNRVEWDGPWNPADVATVKLYGTGKEVCLCSITKINMPIEYTTGPIDNSGRGASALRISYDGAEVISLARVGTVAGVSVDHIAALGGEGAGVLVAEGDGQIVRWKAPGSSTYGRRAILAGGLDIVVDLPDGEDPDKFMRVTLDSSELPETETEGKVYTKRRYLEGTDVTAAQASAGNTVTYTFVIENASDFILSNLKVWIDDSVDFLEISDQEGAGFVSPTTEATALEFPDLAPGETDNLYVKRTIPAVTSFDPAVPLWLHFAFDGGP